MDTMQQQCKYKLLGNIPYYDSLSDVLSPFFEAFVCEGS